MPEPEEPEPEEPEPEPRVPEQSGPPPELRHEMVNAAVAAAAREAVCMVAKAQAPCPTSRARGCQSQTRVLDPNRSEGRGVAGGPGNRRLSLRQTSSPGYLMIRLLACRCPSFKLARTAPGVRVTRGAEHVGPRREVLMELRRPPGQQNNRSARCHRRQRAGFKNLALEDGPS